MVFERGVVLEDWKSAVIVPLYKGKEERSDCKNYRGISLLSKCGWKNIFGDLSRQSSLSDWGFD